MRSLRSCLGAVLCAALLATPASAQSTTAPAIGAASGPDTGALRAIETQVAQIRGLQPLAEPDLRVLDRVSLNTYLADQFQQDYLPSERESDQKELAALGLIK